jgi:signal transduction histidine kinase
MDFIIAVRREIRQKTIKLQKSNRAILDMEAHLRLQQKLEAIGVLASGVAHEINNPINGVLNYGQLIYDIADDDSGYDDSRESILSYSSEIISESNRISSIVSNLLQLSKNGSKQFTDCDIGELINKILNLVTTIINRDQIGIEVKIDGNLPKVECREQELQQVVLNLIVNAKDALNEKYVGYNKDKQIIVIATETVLPGNAKGIRITIEDHGKGIPKEVQNSIFDPFFTTKSRAESTGLGLSISYGIIKQHNGELSFETKEGEYTRFHIDLPVIQTNENQ